MLGEHSRELLREYGYDDSAIDRFVADGVIEEASAAEAGS
jgi:crotonobetainyl-CoA:carnitine CoA-transferase CaiB-like acyl-CoA transferase